MSKKATVIAVSKPERRNGKRQTTCEKFGSWTCNRRKKGSTGRYGPTGIALRLAWEIHFQMNSPPTLSDVMGKIITDTPIAPGEGICITRKVWDYMPANIELSGLRSLWSMR